MSAENCREDYTIAIEKLRPDRRIEDLEATVSDFWSWALSEMRDNTVRGMYAEYIVARRLGADNSPRTEWLPFDIKYDFDGKSVGIEVKASAYLQNWEQKDKNGKERFSNITFDVGKKSPWNSRTGKYDPIKKRSADCYVFCLYKQKDRSCFDQDDIMNVKGWNFYVMSKQKVDMAFKDRKRVSLSVLEGTGVKSVSFIALKDAIDNELKGR